MFQGIKIAITSRYQMRIKASAKELQENRFAFIAHPRSIKEIQRHIPLLKILPKRYQFKLMALIWPLLMSKMNTGLKAGNGKEIIGDLIIIPQVPELIFKNLRGLRKKVKDAVVFGRKRGSHLHGLGALIPPAVSGGKWLESEADVQVATGTSFNSWIVLENLYETAQKLSVDMSEETVSIIGASQQTGVFVATALNGRCRKIILSDIPGKKNRLMSLKEKLGSTVKHSLIEVASSSDEVAAAGILLIFTSAKGTLPEVDMLRPGTLILDDTQPRAVSKEYENSRDDLLVMEGGVVALPGFNPHFHFGLKFKEEMWGCLAETVLMTWIASNGGDGNSILFSENPESAAKNIDRAAKEAGFILTEPRSRGVQSLTAHGVLSFQQARQSRKVAV